MKKTLTLSMTFVGLSLLLAPAAGRAQQQVAALAPRDNAPRLEAGGTATRPSAAEYRSRINALQRRKAALRKYLSSVSPGSPDHVATERSLAEIGVKLDDVARNLVSLEFPSASAPPDGSRSRATREAARAEPAAPSGAVAQQQSLTATTVSNDGEFANISVDVTNFKRNKIKVVATDSQGNTVWSGDFPVDREDDVFTIPNIKLAAAGATTVTVSSFDGTVSTTVTVPAVANTKKASDDGGVVGYSLGGMVVSQQAQNFNQADPFFGFIAGYTSRTRGEGALAWRWNLRFQGIFTASGRTAQETETAEGSDGETPEPAPSPDPFKFIASRKTFDVDAHLWVDLWARNAFSIGPYIAWGASTVMDKNELQGEAVIVDENNDGEPDDNQVVTDSQSDNDLKQFREYGMLMNMKFGDGPRPLFIQAILAKGWYEALKDLDGTDDDTRNRFIGKLRVFPEGLGFMNKTVTPMFGVDMNAGTGPDQVKFFTGFAVRLKGLNITGK